MHVKVKIHVKVMALVAYCFIFLFLFFIFSQDIQTLSRLSQLSKLLFKSFNFILYWF